MSLFVDKARIEHKNRRNSSEIVVPGQEEVRKKAERTILEAEKFKAAIASPQGNEIDRFRNLENSVTDANQMNELMGMTFPKVLNELQFDQNNKDVLVNPSNPPLVIGGIRNSTGISDDDFFHLICHVDQNLKEKIERGDYVDLDKLLTKDRGWNGDITDNTEGEKLEWIRNETGTFLMPARRTSRINCFRRWEQAFRVYATIYCGKNPSRSREIWQYISVINTATSSFIWKMSTTTT